jgi:ABC-type Fe3+/spermidine/putrescine transport system ATPase subunit
MLQVQNISFGYLNKPIIQNIDFRAHKGRNFSIIGESGCGKTTLLKLIYGLYDLDQGNIFWNTIQILGPKHNLVPGMPFIKYLAQDYDLMPYATVGENVGKYLSNTDKVYKNNRVFELLDMVEMSEYVNTKVQFLSGGQMQRVALARVIALEPEILLLDEPFSNIDSFRKEALRRNLFAYLKHKDITCIIATHDSIDALSFSDETVVLKNGQIVQHDTATAVYLKPKNKYVASLFGEVNEINIHFLMPYGDKEKTVLLYANELFQTDISDLKVIVRNCYFKGHNYLVKAIFNRQIIFFESEFKIPDNNIVHLMAYENTIENRI